MLTTKSFEADSLTPWPSALRQCSGGGGGGGGRLGGDRRSVSGSGGRRGCFRR